MLYPCEPSSPAQTHKPSTDPLACINWVVHARRCMRSRQAAPAQRALSAELRITDGPQNCPFFMCITRPVRAAATMRSVCRHRKAGIWMMSATAAIASAWDASWMSVMIGSPSVSLTTCSTLPALGVLSSAAPQADAAVTGLARGRAQAGSGGCSAPGEMRGARLSPSSMPGPRKDAALVRLALSKLALKTSLSPSASVTALIWRANFRQCASDSTTFGPAIKKKGRAAFRLLKKSDSWQARQHHKHARLLCGNACSYMLDPKQAYL